LQPGLRFAQSGTFSPGFLRSFQAAVLFIAAAFLIFQYVANSLGGW
jgi:hypothetical protein